MGQRSVGGGFAMRDKKRRVNASSQFHPNLYTILTPGYADLNYPPEQVRTNQAMIVMCNIGQMLSDIKIELVV
jgi:hypothetical protein